MLLLTNALCMLWLYALFPCFTRVCASASDCNFSSLFSWRINYTKSNAVERMETIPRKYFDKQKFPFAQAFHPPLPQNYLNKIQSYDFLLRLETISLLTDAIWMVASQVMAKRDSIRFAFESYIIFSLMWHFPDICEMDFSYNFFFSTRSSSLVGAFFCIACQPDKEVYANKTCP